MKVSTTLKLMESNHDYSISEVDVDKNTNLVIEIEGLKQRAYKDAVDDVEIFIDCAVYDDDDTCLTSNAIRFSVGNWEPIDDVDDDGEPVFGKTSLTWHDMVK